MKSKVSTFALTLLLICMLSITFNTLLVQATDPGTGKFLTIYIDGQGSVNALKVKSGDTWDFPPSITEKVGAGTVLLTATAAEGWEFSHWDGDVTDDSAYQTTYKTVKYGVVTAVFVRTLFKITVSTTGQGNISLNGEIVAGDVYVAYGATPTFTFMPEEDNYISSVAVNGGYLSSFAPSYTFPPVTADQTLDVYFSLEGTATVPAGTDVTVFLNPSESLMFDNAAGGGTATVDDLEEIADYPVGTLAAGWIIDVDFTFSDQVLITLQYDPGNLTLEQQLNLRLIRGETLEAVRSDVNGDLVVNGDDVSDVANAVKHPEWYNPLCDVNNDGVVNEDDVHIVNENIGVILEDITFGDVDTVNHIIYGITDEFSIFGVR